ncbi:MAG TPA: arginine deiminase family protein [Actinomycetota bacterium]
MSYGATSATAPLKRVLVRPPMETAGWEAYGWRSEPDIDRMVREHEAYVAELEAAGAEVVAGTTRVPGDPDAIYPCDVAIVTERGAIVLRPGKAARRGEQDAIAADFEAAGVPIVGRLEEPATAEGGDLLWLDERTLVVGRSYRTNDEGIAALRELLPEVEVVSVDLPHHHGAGVILHLLSLISMLDEDLAVAHPPLLPVRLMEMLGERRVRLIEVPEEELDSQGPNVLALGPRVALALEGSPVTRRRMEAAGVDVRVYAGEDLCRKGDGGPTCLAQPILRG